MRTRVGPKSFLSPRSPPAERRVRPSPTPTIDAILNVSNSISREALEELDAAFAALPINQPPTRSNLITRLLHVREHQHVDPATTSICLFDNFAYRVAPHKDQPWRVQPWETQIVAVYQQACATPSCAEGTVWCPNHTERREQVNAVLTALWKISKVVNYQSCGLQPWLETGLNNRTTQVSIQKRLGVHGKFDKQDRSMYKDILELVPEDETGMSMTVVRLPEDEYTDGEELVTCPTVKMRMELTARTRVCSGGGFGVVSTLEGTLWEVDSSDPASVLRAVFTNRQKWDPTSKNEMAKLLEFMRTTLGNPPFWYISLAPYCLYSLLRDLRDQRYPFGVLLMRNNPWGLASDLLASFMLDAQSYKLEHLQKIYQTWPNRRMVLIGSATQCDAKAFAEMYRQHPHWIEAIVLRRLPQDVWSYHCTEQTLQCYFSKVPRNLWCVFSDAEPKEAYSLIDDMKRNQA